MSDSRMIEDATSTEPVPLEVDEAVRSRRDSHAARHRDLLLASIHPLILERARRIDVDGEGDRLVIGHRDHPSRPEVQREIIGGGTHLRDPHLLVDEGNAYGDRDRHHRKDRKQLG